MTSPMNHASSNPGNQRGVALVIGLIFLVGLTLIGLTSVGDNELQRRMSHGSSESNLAFQAAEAALGAGENWLGRQDVQPVPDCQSPCKDTASIWLGNPPIGEEPEVNITNLRTPAWWATEGRTFGRDYTSAGPVTIAGQSIPWASSDQPRYVIEQIKDPQGSLVAGLPQVTPDTWYYQVTARGRGNLPNQVSLVQSIFARTY